MPNTETAADQINSAQRFLVFMCRTEKMVITAVPIL